MGPISTLGGTQWNSLENKPQADISQVSQLSLPTILLIYRVPAHVSFCSLSRSSFPPSCLCASFAETNNTLLLEAEPLLSFWSQFERYLLRGVFLDIPINVCPLSLSSNNSIASLNFIFLITYITIHNYLSSGSAFSFF